MQWQQHNLMDFMSEDPEEITKHLKIVHELNLLWFICACVCTCVVVGVFFLCVCVCVCV